MPSIHLSLPKLRLCNNGFWSHGYTDQNGKHLHISCTCRHVSHKANLNSVFLFKWKRRGMALCRWVCSARIMAKWVNLSARLCLVAGDRALHRRRKSLIAGTKGKLSLFEALKFREKCFFLVKNLLARLCNRKAEVILSSTIKTAIRLAVAFTAS